MWVVSCDLWVKIPTSICVSNQTSFLISHTIRQHLTTSDNIHLNEAPINISNQPRVDSCQRNAWLFGMFCCSTTAQQPEMPSKILAILMRVTSSPWWQPKWLASSAFYTYVPTCDACSYTLNKKQRRSAFYRLCPEALCHKIVRFKSLSLCGS